MNNSDLDPCARACVPFLWKGGGGEGAYKFDSKMH